VVVVVVEVEVAVAVAVAVVVAAAVAAAAVAVAVEVVVRRLWSILHTKKKQNVFNNRVQVEEAMGVTSLGNIIFGGSIRNLFTCICTLIWRDISIFKFSISISRQELGSTMKPSYQISYRNYHQFSDTLCFQTPPIFHQNN